MNDSTDSTYRLERWIALFLALLFLLPFVARADERTATWRCTPTEVHDFQQCALVVNGEVVTWRMLPANEKLHARVRDAKIEISRDGKRWVGVKR